MKLLLLLLLCIVALSTTCSAQWLQYDKAANPRDSNTVRSFAESIVILKSGEVISGFHKGIFRWNKGLWENYSTDSTEFMRGSLLSMIKDSSDNLWVATGYGLKYYDTKLQKITKQFMGTEWARDSNKIPTSQFYHEVRSIAIDSTGGLWLSGYSNGFDLARFKDGVWTRYPVANFQDYSKYGIAGDQAFTSLEVEKSGCLWYTANEGIGRFDPTTNTRTFFDTLRIGNEVISLKSAGKIQITRDGKVWLNAQTDYILSFTPKDSVWTVYHKNEIPIIRDEDKTQTLYRQAVAEDAKGNLWMTFRRDYLAKFDTTTKKWKKIQLPNGRYYDMGTRTLIEGGLAVDGKGQVWVGTLAEGVVVYTGEASSTIEAPKVDEKLIRAWIYPIIPNPVTAQARVQIFSDPSLRASLQVGLYSILGSEISNLTSTVQMNWATGYGTLDFDVRDIPNGVYLLRVSNGADNYVSLMPVMR
ncbi:MAG: hypothetical protein U0264_14355 [Candidatus Kapaibacterium sp.]